MASLVLGEQLFTFLLAFSHNKLIERLRGSKIIIELAFVWYTRQQTTLFPAPQRV